VQGESRLLSIEGADGRIADAAVAGPEAWFPEFFYGFEEYYNPRLRGLRRRYGIDAAVDGETDEFQKILRLRHWVHSQWRIDNNNNYHGDAFAILEKAKAGDGFNCHHSMIVQEAVFATFGLVSRYLGVDRDHRDLGRSVHHGVNEVWSNDFAKWVLSDAKYDVHYERDGIPLSALEVHEGVRADGGQGITMVQGLERRPTAMSTDPEYPEASVRNYWWVAYHTRQDPFTHPHWSGGSRMVVFDSDAFRETKWLRGSRHGLREHWAYAADAFIRTRDRRQIEWTPGIPALRARQVAPRELDVQLRSATPNFRAYRVRINGGPWKTLRDGLLRWRLRRGANSLQVRTRNLFGVDGPVVTSTVRVL
jgi:hypothetical protein